MEKVEQTDDNFKMLIIFKLKGEVYGIPIEQVKEITYTPKITKIPRTPPYIKGVANIRGEIIPVLDLEERLKLATDTMKDEKSFTIVTELEELSMGIIVEEVPQSITISTSQIKKTPGLVQEVNIDEGYIEGLAKVAHNLIIILDLNKILTSHDIQLLTETN